MSKVFITGSTDGLGLVAAQLLVEQGHTVVLHARNVFSNAVGPGWVPTKMGGPGAPDDMAQASVTQVWLATSNEPTARVSAKYFYQKKLSETHPAVHDIKVQDQLLAACESLSGVHIS